MLSMLRKTTASMAKSGRSVASRQYGAADDLSSWEFVDPSQSDEEDLYSFDDGEITSDGDDSIGEDPGVKSEEEENASESRDFVHQDDIISMQSLSVSPPIHFPVDVIHRLAYQNDFDDVEKKDEADSDEDEDDDRDGVYSEDVDDELIPWKLKDRFEKQRIRKMGKRNGTKMTKSKRLPYYYNRPGCLYGKHGLGVQHSYI